MDPPHGIVGGQEVTGMVRVDPPRGIVGRRKGQEGGARFHSPVAFLC